MSQRSFLPLFLVYTLFFLWGFAWNLFNVLAAFFQETFHLSNTATSLGTSVSFLAFFLLSYPAGLIIRKTGTRNAIAAGAIVSSLGLFLFVPASFLKSYPVFLVGLFALFSGITLLQTVCNPYIGTLGAEKNRAARINFAQGIGAIGAALTAPLGGWFILELFKNDLFGGIKVFYLLIAGVFLLLGILVRTSEMPANPTDSEKNTPVSSDRKGVFKYPHFATGFIIMFLYMGAEAVLYQLMTPYFKIIGGISTSEAVRYSSVIFYGLMAGRLLGAWMMTKLKTNLMLGLFALVAAILVITSIISGGKTGIYAITGTGFFISILFASIFSLATTHLGKYTNQASSLLIMGISGGFFLPLLFGIVADGFSLRTSLIVVVIPLLLASFYGFAFPILFKKSKSGV